MNEQQPIIDPHMKDYTLEQKKSKTIKIAIVLTVILFATMGFIFYSMNSKLGTVSHIGNGERIKESTTKTVSESVITSNMNEFENVYIIDVTNTSNETVNATLAFNTYNNGELEDTHTYELFALDSKASSMFVVKKSDLKIYDKVDFKVTSSKSLQTSLVLKGITVNQVSSTSTDNLSFEVKNDTGKFIDAISIVTLFYKDNKLVDAVVGTSIGLEETTTINVKKSTLVYDTISTKVIEAYSYK